MIERQQTLTVSPLYVVRSQSVYQSAMQTYLKIHSCLEADPITRRIAGVSKPSSRLNPLARLETIVYFQNLSAATGNQ